MATYPDGTTSWASSWRGLSKSASSGARFAWTEPEILAEAPPALPADEGRNAATDVRAAPATTLAVFETPGPAQPQPEALPSPPAGTDRQQRFILTAAEAARVSQRETGVPASITIAQAILESSWGKSRLSSEFNNYFGIKAKERPGTAGVTWFNTWEVVDGADEIQHEPFRAYKTAADSFVDHGRFIQRNPRYKTALAVSHDPRQFAREINKAGYATDPDYAAKLIRLMDQFNLYVYNR